MADATEVEAWRVFGLSPDGVLFAPYGPICWPDAKEGLRLWESVEQTAGCIAREHPAPAEGCMCGIRGVVDRDVLIATAGQRPIDFTHVLADAGVIGKVGLEGRMLPGVAIPHDDPPTTLRAERARLLELHVGPAHAPVAPRVAARYVGVPVRTYDDDDEGLDFVPSSGREVQPSGPDTLSPRCEPSGSA